MSKAYIVLGLSEFAYSTAVQLARSGEQVVVVDRNEALIQRIADDVTRAVCADVEDTEVLEELGIQDFDVAIIGMARHFDVSVLLVHYLKRIGVPHIIAQVNSDAAAEAIKVVGATEAVFPERDSARRIANSLLFPGLLDRIDVAEDSVIVEIATPARFVGKTIKDLDIRRKFHVYVIGIKRCSPKDGKCRTIVAPPPDTAFTAGDTMLVLGKRKSVNSFVTAVESFNAPAT